MEGLWVDENELPMEQIRLAAEDDTLARSARYEAGPHAVFLHLDEGGEWLVSQVAGPTGTSLRFGTLYVVLEPGKESVLPQVEALPAHLVLVDAAGREWRLERVYA
jgi:hypothetical protein